MPKGRCDTGWGRGGRSVGRTLDDEQGMEIDREQDETKDRI